MTLHQPATSFSFSVQHHHKYLCLRNQYQITSSAALSNNFITSIAIETIIQSFSQTRPDFNLNFFDLRHTISLSYPLHQTYFISLELQKHCHFSFNCNTLKLNNINNSEIPVHQNILNIHLNQISVSTHCDSNSLLISTPTPPAHDKTVIFSLQFTQPKLQSHCKYA